MPPCRKICTGRCWMPTPVPTPAPAASACCPAPAPAPAPAPECSCDEEPMLTCDEDTCANAADCKQLHPEICPHGLATDDDRTASQPPAKPDPTHLICPHCQSHIAMFDDLKQPPDSRQSQTRNTCPAQKKPKFCNTNCPFNEDIKQQSANSPAPSRSSSAPKLRSPHISQITVTALIDLQDSCPDEPESPDGAMSCRMSGSAARRAPHMGRTSGGMDSDSGPKGGAVKGESAAVPCKVCLQAAAAEPPAKCCPSAEGQTDHSSSRGVSQSTQMGQNAARPARNTSGKGKSGQNLPGSRPPCPRSGTPQLFPARPAPQPCLCRMPPAYPTGCTGNLSGNCNCNSCNK